MRDPKERLRDILQAIEAIDRYRACERGEFDQNEMLQVWFLRHLQIIGDAARHVPDEVRGMAPDIPWNKIIGMRNILVWVLHHRLGHRVGRRAARCAAAQARCSGTAQATGGASLIPTVRA